jgi:hypothetical protein
MKFFLFCNVIIAALLWYEKINAGQCNFTTHDTDIIVATQPLNIHGSSLTQIKENTAESLLNNFSSSKRTKYVPCQKTHPVDVAAAMKRCEEATKKETRREQQFIRLYGEENGTHYFIKTLVARKRTEGSAAEQRFLDYWFNQLEIIPPAKSSSCLILMRCLADSHQERDNLTIP